MGTVVYEVPSFIVRNDEGDYNLYNFQEDESVEEIAHAYE